MQPLPDLSSPDPATPLPGIVCRAMVRDLVHGLPDPIGNTPDARAERDHAAIAEAALLAPADAGELRIALRCVTADARAHAFLRLMNAYSEDVRTLLRLSTQAAAMERCANASRTLLLRTQAQRRRHTAGATAEADEQAAQRAQDGLMQAWQDLAGEGATPLPKAPPLPAPARAAPRAATSERARWEQAVAQRRQEYEAAMAAGLPEPDWINPAWRLALGLPEPPPPTEEEKQRLYWLRQADRYAIIHPMRSRLIRRLGNLPPDCGVEPPEPALLEAIRSGNEANQEWADRMTPAEARMNAGRDRHLLCRYEEGLEGAGGER